jgi:hypothetical protein
MDLEERGNAKTARRNDLPIRELAGQIHAAEHLTEACGYSLSKLNNIVPMRKNSKMRVRAPWMSPVIPRIVCSGERA